MLVLNTTQNTIINSNNRTSPQWWFTHQKIFLAILNCSIRHMILLILMGCHIGVEIIVISWIIVLPYCALSDGLYFTHLFLNFNTVHWVSSKIYKRKKQKQKTIIYTLHFPFWLSNDFWQKPQTLWDFFHPFFVLGNMKNLPLKFHNSKEVYWIKFRFGKLAS